MIMREDPKKEKLKVIEIKGFRIQRALETPLGIVCCSFSTTIPSFLPSPPHDCLHAISHSVSLSWLTSTMCQTLRHIMFTTTLESEFY